MSSQRISLPGIHELFPEHLMHSQPIPSSSKVHASIPYNHQEPARNISGSGPLLSHHRQIRTAAPPHPSTGQQSTAYQTASSYAPGQRHPSDYRNQPISNTAPPLSLDTSLSRSSAFASEPTSHLLSTPHDTHRQRQALLNPPIHIIDSARIPSSQDHYRYPDSQFSDPRATFMRVSGSSSPPSALDDSESFSGDEASTTGAPPGIPRKHVCPICSKAFNRPSSLKIHYNTHTGATPFRCPWPKCGREFNVNSNMRRHLRNHTSNTNQEIPDDGARRRRRRSSASSTNSPLVAIPQQPTGGDMRTHPQGNAPHYQVPPPHYDVPSRVSETPRYYSRYTDDCKQEHYQMDTDDTDEFHASEDPHRSSRRSTVPVMRVSETLTEPRGTVSSRYHPTPTPTPQQEHQYQLPRSSSAGMRARALTPGSSFHSSSPSPSPSPSLSSPTSSSFATPPPSALTSPTDSPAVLPRQPRPSTTVGGKYQYSPSMHYLRSTTGVERVSTALRPAFNTGNTAHR